MRSRDLPARQKRRGALYEHLIIVGLVVSLGANLSKEQQ